MSTVLRAVPCRRCGHRIGLSTEVCPYCGVTPSKPKGPVAAPVQPPARAVGRCARCGGRMARQRGMLVRLLARVGIRPKPHSGQRLTCSSCGYLERRR